MLFFPFSTLKRACFSPQSLFLLGLIIALLPSSYAATLKESEILRQLDNLRNVKPTTDEKELAKINNRMDGAWRLLSANKAESTPLIRRELARELDKARSDQFFILDVGKLLVSLDGVRAEPLAVSALAKVDPDAGVIQSNFQELFEFTHDLAKFGSTNVLPQIDRLFLDNTEKLEFLNAPHYVKFDATDLCVVLYGVTGTNGEAHLVKLLTERPASRLRVLETLCWLGSEECAESVKKVMAAAGGDYETIVRSITFMMTLGGPSGRTAVLNLDSAPLDARTKAYYQQILPAVREMSSKGLLADLKRFDDPKNKPLTDEQLKIRLKKMYDNFGVDDETNPSSITASALPKTYLIGQLKEIRSRMFFRKDNHALDDVKITNLIINTLQYMP